MQLQKLDDRDIFSKRWATGKPEIVLQLQSGHVFKISLITFYYMQYNLTFLLSGRQGFCFTLIGQSLGEII